MVRIKFSNSHTYQEIPTTNPQFKDNVVDSGFWLFRLLLPLLPMLLVLPLLMLLLLLMLELPILAAASVAVDIADVDAANDVWCRPCLG